MALTECPGEYAILPRTFVQDKNIPLIGALLII